jgi:hypothetical protein
MIVSAPARRITGLGDDIAHVGGRQKLPFLDVHRLAGSGDGLDEIGLATQEGGRLQDIDNAGNRSDIFLTMDIGKYRYANLAAHFREYLQTGVDARPALRPTRAAVGLVVRGLENVRQPEARTDFFQLSGNIDAQGQ